MTRLISSLILSVFLLSPASSSFSLPLTSSAAQPSSLFQYSPWDFVLAAAWSPNGKLLADAAGVSIHIYEMPSGQELYTWNTGTWSSSLVFYQPVIPGQLILIQGGRDGLIHFWDPGSGEEICSLEAHPTGVNNLSLRSDGKILASGGGDPIARLWDLPAVLDSHCQDAKPVAELIGATFAVPDIRYSPDGSLLGSVDYHAVRLREPDTQRLVYTLDSQTSIFTIDFSPDGKLVAAGELGLTARLWDTTTGMEKFSLTDPDGLQKSPRAFLWKVAFQPGGTKLVGAESSGRVVLWDTSAPASPPEVLAGHTKAVATLAFSPDGRYLATGGLDAALRVWAMR